MPIKSRTDTLTTKASALVMNNQHSTISWGPCPPNSEHTIGYVPSYTINSLNEIIEDELTGGTRFGRCYHHKDKATVMTPGPLEHMDFDSDRSYKRSYRYEDHGNISQLIDYAASHDVANNPNCMLNFLSGTTPDWESYDWGSFSNRAYRAMEPSLESNFSVLNFLWELKDFKRLHQHVTGQYKLFRGMGSKDYIKNLGPKLKKSLSNLYKAVTDDSWNPQSRRTMRKGVETLAGAHLSWEFAIKPLVSDLQRMSTILSSFNERIEDFRNRAGVVQTRHYVEYEDGTPKADQSIELGLQHDGLVRQTALPQVERHATMQYVYSIPYMSDIFTKVAGTLAMLGISPSRPSIVWNAIPFTFLVDWFFDVGQLLDDLLGHDVIPADVKIMDFCVSQKAMTTLHVSRVIHDELDRITGHDSNVMVLEREVYQRERMVPTIDLLSDLRPPSWRKIAIANSLLWAVMGRRKR